MINGLSEMEKYKVIRPLFGDYKLDAFDMPVIKKTDLQVLDWEKLKATGIQNASSKTADKNTLVFMFNYDKKLQRLWNSPLKYIGLFQQFAAICTPDFSLYPSMNSNEIRHNVFKSRWLGATWQSYDGVYVLPTIGWASPDTYDICFSGIEFGSVVVISTIGCERNRRSFLEGFYEMRSRINPPLIVLLGDIIDGMAGTFLTFSYTDTFLMRGEKKQLCFEGIQKVFTISEVV